MLVSVKMHCLTAPLPLRGSRAAETGETIEKTVERERARESADCTALCVALKCSPPFRMVAEGDLWVDWTGSKSETPTA